MEFGSSKITPKKLTFLSWAGVFYGFTFAAVGITSLGKEEGIFLLISGIIFIIAGISSLIYLKRRKVIQNNNRLNTVLYELIKKNQGRITVMEFAISANIEPIVAREFIESKVSQIGSVPEIDEQGTIYYMFR